MKKCLPGIVLALATAFFGTTWAQKSAPPDNSAKAQPAGAPAALARGRDVYHARCEICHFSDSEAQKIGPGLKELYKRGKFSDGNKVDDVSLEKWILNGSKNMPPYKEVLNYAQIHDLIAYMKTL